MVFWHSARIASFSSVTVTGGKATATVDLTEASAKLINVLAGKQIATAGEAIGTATVAPTLM